MLKNKVILHSMYSYMSPLWNDPTYFLKEELHNLNYVSIKCPRF